MRPLILLGASVRAAAYSALRADYTPYGIDLFADRDLAALGPAVKVASFPSEFLTALATAPQATWLYTGGLENYPRLVDRLADIRPLFGNPGHVLRQVRDPQRLMAAAIEAGCRFPQNPIQRRRFANSRQNVAHQTTTIQRRHRNSNGSVW